MFKFINVCFVVCGIFFFATGCKSPETPDSSVTAPATDQNKSVDVLKSWNEPKRGEIIAWVSDVTDSLSQNFIPKHDRIAVFDNDGTLWPEQPVPTQLIYAIDKLRSMSADHPEWSKDEVINGAINGDMEPVKKAGVPGLLKIINASHTNQTVDEFKSSVKNWIDTTRNAKYDRTYRELIYQPMMELIDLLKQNKFKVFIVSGGGADFMRAWSDEVYGLAPYQVVGSYGSLKYEVVDGNPRVTKTEGDIYVDDKAGKPVAIHRFIGKVPVFCGGNSDGDQAMMQYASGSPYKSMCVILHHTDSVREYAYDLKTLSGHLESALVEASEKNWMVVDMEKDFNRIWPFEQ